MGVSDGLVLSLFPGIGLLDMGFEDAGFCIVRGPDVLWGGDIHTFHPPAGRFDGVIGGPPCKAHSPLANIVRAVHGDDAVAPDLIPEFERVVCEARPTWFLMENVRNAPQPTVTGYIVQSVLLNNRMFGGVQHRERRFSFGTRDGLRLSASSIAASITAIPGEWEPAVTSNSGGRRAVIVRDDHGRVRGHQGEADYHRLRNRSVTEIATLQGLPSDFLSDAPFTVQGKREVIGNGVPLPMARAVALAVRSSIGQQIVAQLAREETA